MRTQSTFTIIFYTRKSRCNPQLLTVYARITVNKLRAEISLKRSIHKNEWDSNKNRGKGNSPEVLSLNTYLGEVYRQLLECHRELLSEGKLIAADAIKSRYLGEDEKGKTLKDLIHYHNTTMGHVLKEGTLKNYYTTERYLQKFLMKKKRVKDIYLKQLNYAFIIDFEHFLRNYKNENGELMQTNNGVMKHLERFKKLLNLAVKLEWMHKNPFSKFQMKYHKYDRAYLTQRELEIIETTEFKADRLERIKDCFLFSCYTGLSYVDAKELTKDHLVRGIDNRIWLFTKREKTQELVKIPLLPKAWEILEKYLESPENETSGKILPICSNQKTNKYIREIAESCGVRKHFTFHVARHTFATTVMLTNGVPIETVSKLLGHTKLSTTQIYARVIDTKISEDMDNLLERIEGKRMVNSR